MIRLKRFEEISRQFPQRTILVVGDVILDRYIFGRVSRISPEAPVPVVKLDEEEFRPGGAGNVCANINSLGAKAYLVGVVGKDERAGILKGELEHRGVNIDGIFADPQRPTILKTRVIAHQQQVVRIDKEKVDPLKDATVKKIANFVENIIDEMDGIVVEDYGKEIKQIFPECDLTISIGVTSLKHPCSPDLDEFLERVDKALYSAKERGRNRVCVDQ